MKIYTDSPNGTIMMTNENGFTEEMKISLSKFNVRIDDQTINKNNLKSIKKEGIII